MYLPYVFIVTVPPHQT